MRLYPSCASPTIIKIIDYSTCFIFRSVFCHFFFFDTLFFIDTELSLHTKCFSRHWVFNWVGAAKMKKSVSPVVKNPSSTHLFRNLHTDYLMPLEQGNKYGEIFHTMSTIFCWSSYNYLRRDNKSHLASGLDLNPNKYISFFLLFSI